MEPVTHRCHGCWAEGITGEGIVVANLDTGVDWDHPALKPHYRGWNGSTANHEYNWHDVRTSCGAIPCDTDQHGTHTMGTMVGDDGAGNQVGGAPGAKWIACGPLNDDAGFHECFEWFLAPYRYGETPAQGVPAMAPHVVNNSWGWPIGGGDYQYAPDLDALQAAGVFMEFSAGNEGDACQSLRPLATIRSCSPPAPRRSEPDRRRIMDILGFEPWSCRKWNSRRSEFHQAEIVAPDMIFVHAFREPGMKAVGAAHPWPVRIPARWLR